MSAETVFSVSDRTDAMTVTMTDEGPELPPGTADPNGNQSEVKFCLILPLKADKNGRVLTCCSELVLSTMIFVAEMWSFVFVDSNNLQFASNLNLPVYAFQKCIMT